MIKTIFKQIGASKRANTWIFIQLLIIFVATWLVLDPVYTILYQKARFEDGFEVERLYVLKVENIIEEEEDPDPEEAALTNFNKLMELVKSYPGVITVIPQTHRFVYSGSQFNVTFMNPEDTLRLLNAQIFTLYKGSDFFKTFRFRDAATGRYDLFDSIPYIPNGVFITQTAEEILFGKGKGVGKELCFSNTNIREIKYKVMGVLESVKGLMEKQAMPLVWFLEDYYSYHIDPEDPDESFVSGLQNDDCCILFRINDGADETLFMEQFKKELFPKLMVGNLYVSDMDSMQSLRKADYSDTRMSTTLILQSILAFFFLINIMLAVFATFWLRTGKRKGEIGIMMALGATRKGIKHYFLAESMCLFTLSAVTGILVLVQIVYFKGLYMLEQFSEAEKATTSYARGWLINNETAHFAAVTLITILIVGITVALAAWLPASRAAKTHPADALKEE